MSTKMTQDYGDKPIAVRKTDHYKEEYVHTFVKKWDDLINWEARESSEGQFFIDVLKERGAKQVLDVACGTGFHSIRLLKAGFEVVSADGSPEMLAQAFANGRDHGFILRTVQADWRWLSRDIHSKFDAVICLGNSFTHLFSEHDRRKSLAEFYTALRNDGILILDQRNYDTMLDHGYSSKHTYYYCGKNIKAYPEYIDPGLARFRYEFPDDSVFHLNMFPLRKEYTRKLMYEVGFQTITTYGDFVQDPDDDDKDFFIHVADKTYVPPQALKQKDRDHTSIKEAYSETVETAREYYNSDPADRFYATIWGGEDIHMGLYEYDGEPITRASRRTVDRMMDEIADEVTPETRILDIGAGYGGAARQLVRRFGCKVVCLNLSEVQNDRNRELNREQQLVNRIEVIDGNFEDIPYPDDSFDIIWSQDSLLHSGNRERVIEEAARVLKPGGPLIFTDPLQAEGCTKEDIQPVLERIHLDSMGSLPFYQEAARRHGLQEEKVIDYSEQLANHYASVRKRLEEMYDELVEACGREYPDKMHAGLGHWVEASKRGLLRWGILLFRKQR